MAEVGWRLVKLRDNGDGGLRCHHAPPAKAAQQWRACYGVLLPCCDSEKQSKRSWPTVLPLPPPSPARAVRGGDGFDDPWLLSPTTSWTTTTMAFSSSGARQRHGSAVCLSPFGAGRMQRCGVTDSRPPSDEYERVCQPLNIPFSSSLPSRLALSIRNNSGAPTMVAAMACHHAPPAKAAQQWRACYGVLLPCCDSEKQSKRSWPTVLPLPPPSPARAVRGGDGFEDPWLLSPTTSWTTATMAFSSGGARQRHGSAVCLSPFGARRMQRCGVTDSRPPSE
nr:hypothetical protein Iba_chr12cCG13510 [Ipomoea batatas]